MGADMVCLRVDEQTLAAHEKVSSTFFAHYAKKGYCLCIIYAYAKAMNNEIIDKYQRAATENSLSLTELCIEAGVAPSTITRWRNGQRPWGATLRKLDLAIARIASERQGLAA